VYSSRIAPSEIDYETVIKWIHLEHQDDGLKAFFHKCSSSLTPGGYLVIELQTWDSYEKAIRPGAAPHFAKNMKSLVYRPESFEQLLAEEGLTLCARSDALPRCISVYRKESTAAVSDHDIAE
jgi:7SK snRNA methylphosphate capping enzyme